MAKRRAFDEGGRLKLKQKHIIVYIIYSVYLYTWRGIFESSILKKFHHKPIHFGVPPFMENCVYIFWYSLYKRTYLKPPTIPTFAIRHQPLGVAKMAAARAQNIPSCQKCPVLVLEKWAYLHGCIIACFKAPNSNAFNAWCRWQVTDVFPCWRFFGVRHIFMPKVFHDDPFLRNRRHMKKHWKT